MNMVVNRFIACQKNVLKAHEKIVELPEYWRIMM